jgi:MSHA biogenesis protein MshL
MHKLTVLVLVAGAFSLAGCDSAPKRETYDAIGAQLAPAKPGAPQVDEAVANALLPPVSALAGQLPKARGTLEERFNVSFQNVPAQQFFHSLVAGTRYNMLVHPEVSGSISANLKDVTLIEALDAVRDMYGYDYRIDGTRISIKPLTMQTRMFKVNYLAGKRRGQSNLRVNSTSVADAGTSGTGNNQSGQGGQNGQNNNNNNNNDPNNPGGSRGRGFEAASLTTTQESDFWADLKLALDAIVVPDAKAGRSVVVSPQSGVVVIRAMPEELRNVDAYLKATQLAVDRQVILEAKILEVELNDSFQSGINWAAFKVGNNHRASGGFLNPGSTLTPLGVTGPISNGGDLSALPGFSLSNAASAAGSMFGLAFQTSNFAALINFLESQGTVHVLSSPRIATVNNQKAVLKIGTDEFYVTGVSTTTNTSAAGNVVTPSVQLQPFFSGVVLDVTPQIDEKGHVLLHVHPSVSQVTTINKGIDLGSMGNFNLPLAASSTSEMDSMVRGLDGHVVAIGGLMRQSSTADRSQLPGAGGLPVVGNLFKTRANVNQKRELVVLIKPTIVDSAAAWNQDLLDTRSRIERLDPAGAERR